MSAAARKDPQILRSAAVALSDLLPLRAASKALGVSAASVVNWRRSVGRPRRPRGRCPDQNWWCPWCGATMAVPGFCVPRCRDEYVRGFCTAQAAQAHR